MSIKLPASPRLAPSAATEGHAKRPATRVYRISCVPYARQRSGIAVSGNAWQWWARAAGRYARGNQPEVGSVLNFRSNRRMPLGHVAVVDRIVNPREIIIEHANWQGGALSGRVTRGVTVVDVSEANNWSAVRVELGRSGDFGSIYPAYGFIYNRPDNGDPVTNVALPAPMPAINPVLSDLRPKAERPWRTVERVADGDKDASQPATLQAADARVVAVSASR